MVLTVQVLDFVTDTYGQILASCRRAIIKRLFVNLCKPQVEIPFFFYGDLGSYTAHHADT